MGTATDTRATAFYASSSRPDATFAGYKIEHRSDGTAVIKDVPIFKAGTFRDSMGDLNTWTAAHLQQMVFNFNLLRDGNIFADVPVRRDHSYSIDKVMGYFESMRSDGELLYADLLVTEPNDIEKLARGTYRSRSLEVGMYVTNTEEAYWPVVYGVAYVDIPAVEGLHNKELAGKYFSRLNDTIKENDVSGTQTPAVDDRAPAKPGDAPATHAAPVPQVHTFRVNGADTVDFGKVQAHIDSLEGFVKETTEKGREDFVKSLATDGKIPATMVEGMTKHAKDLAPDAFAAFRTMYEAAPKLQILSEHGNSNTTPNTSQNGADTTDPVQAEIEVLDAQIKMHRQAGLSEEAIAKTKAFARRQQLIATKN